MEKDNILHTSGKITLAFLAFVLMFICWIGNVFSYGTQSGTTLDLRRGSRVTDYMFHQPLVDTYTFYFGTQSVTGSGTTGYITGTSTALPRLQYNSSGLTFNFVGATLQNEGVDVTVATDLSGYIAVTGGTGTGNVLTNPTLGGTGTISANVALSGNITANSLTISPTELGYLNNATSEIQSQITTATGSITNHLHTGADGTTQIAHNSVTGTGTNSHTTLDIFVSSKAQASGLASLDGSSLVVQNPANSTATPTASKIPIADGAGKIDNGWLNSSAFPYIAQTSGTGTGITLAGNTNLPSGIWNSSGNVGIGTTTPSTLLQIGNVVNLGADLSTGNKLVLSAEAGGVNSHIFTVGAGATYLNWYGGTGGLYVGNGAQGANVYFDDNGNVGIGTDIPSGVLHAERTSGNADQYLRATTNTAFTRFYLGNDQSATRGALQIAGSTSSDTRIADRHELYSAGGGVNLLASDAGGDIRFFAGGVGEDVRIASSGNVGIGTTIPSNILTLPIASATDPIADAWTNHCLADYKDIGTETAEMIQLSANDTIKSVPVSSFTKKALISDDEAEREIKQKYQDSIRKATELDLMAYGSQTGVEIEDSDIQAELNKKWETKADRQTLVETNRQKLIAEKKALPKFQRKQYGIVAEDAPPEAQVLREDGSLQGVDPYPLIGILWANAQKQDERIALLETRIADLSARLQKLEDK